MTESIYSPENPWVFPCVPRHMSPAATIQKLLEGERIFPISQCPESLRWKELLPVIVSNPHQVQSPPGLPWALVFQPGLGASKDDHHMVMLSCTCYRNPSEEQQTNGDLLSSNLKKPRRRQWLTLAQLSVISLGPRLLPSTKCCLFILVQLLPHGRGMPSRLRASHATGEWKKGDGECQQALLSLL